MTLYDRFVQSFRAALRVNTPLIGVETPDPAASTQRLFTTSKDDVPSFLWDCVRGLQPLNLVAEDALANLLDGANPASITDPTGLLAEFAPKLPDRSVLYMMGVGRYLGVTTVDGAAFVQAVWNLRDLYKSTSRALVLLGSSMVLPEELTNDVLLLDEPLPGDTELADIICGVLETNNIPCEGEVKAKAVNAVRGLAAYSTESAVAMASVSGALDFAELWSRKRKMISATPGLSVWTGGETLDDIGGCEQIKQFIKMKASGRNPFQAVLWWDEVEKMLAGATAGTSDSSGTTQGIIGAWLPWQQEANDKGSSGILCVGAPGAAKSMFAKACGATFGVPTIAVDAGAVKSSLVGSTEARFRNLLKVVDAIGGGRILTVMTCNKQVALSPEMKRRMTAGIWYFDLPDDAEQEVIWVKYLTKYEIPLGTKRPNYKGWTGAEIKQACVLVWEMGIRLEDAGAFIVPVAKSAAEEIAALRQQADRKFLSASKPGVYMQVADTTPKMRRMAQEA